MRGSSKNCRGTNSRQGFETRVGPCGALSGCQIAEERIPDRGLKRLVTVTCLASTAIAEERIPDRGLKRGNIYLLSDHHT